MKLLVTAALAASLIATNLYAADATAPLASGKPAGVQKAQDMGGDFWWIAGGVFVAAIVIVAATGSSSGPAAPVVAATTTTG
jgi:hypothetical protein